MVSSSVVFPRATCYVGHIHLMLRHTDSDISDETAKKMDFRIQYKGIVGFKDSSSYVGLHRSVTSLQYQ